MNLKSIIKTRFLYLIVPILLAVSSDIYSQNSKSDKEKVNFGYKFIPSFGIAYQKQFQSELSIIYGSAEKSVGGAYLFGLKGGLEFNYDKNDFILAPKIGFEFSSILCLRLSFARYSTSNKADYYLMPEIGFGVGLCNLTYGYNVLLSESTIENIGRHRISLTFNLF